MVLITGRNIPEAFTDALWQMRCSGRMEETRNGPALTIQDPVLLTIHWPWERVLFDDTRRANPYFHVAEFIWMMAGSNDINWIAKYNKQMHAYSDDGVTQPAAYGHRWREHFGSDQIKYVVDLLKKDPTTRRAVLGMWDPVTDMEPRSADLPCNTHIYFREQHGFLNMTVCNRSNDLVWGMLGANAVHMTMLHELISRSVELAQGTYFVFTNNLHMYKSTPSYAELLELTPTDDQYRRNLHHVPLLNTGENLLDFLNDAEDCVNGSAGAQSQFRTYWFQHVAQPMLTAYEFRRMGSDEMGFVQNILADDWKIAATRWKEWKDAKHSSGGSGRDAG